MYNNEECQIHTTGRLWYVAPHQSGTSCACYAIQAPTFWYHIFEKLRSHYCRPIMYLVLTKAILILLCRTTYLWVTSNYSFAHSIEIRKRIVVLEKKWESLHNRSDIYLELQSLIGTLFILSRFLDMLSAILITLFTYRLWNSKRNTLRSQ